MASQIPIARSMDGDVRGLAFTARQDPAVGVACVCFEANTPRALWAIAAAVGDEEFATRLAAHGQRAAELGLGLAGTLAELRARVADGPATPSPASLLVATLDAATGLCAVASAAPDASSERAEPLARGASCTISSAAPLGLMTLAFDVALADPDAHVLEMQLTSELAAIDAVNVRFAAFAASQHVPDGVRRAFHIAFDDLLNNIVSYAYAGAEHHAIDVRVVVTPDYVEAQVADRGPAFDPFALAEPDTELDLDERAIGGLGVHLIRQLMDECRYERDGDRNVATLRKYLVADGSAAATTDDL